MISELEENLEQISRLCRQFGVKQLDVFGSVATEAFEPARSDIDFVVDFEEVASQSLFSRYFGLKESLEALFGRPVDLVMADAMRNPFFIESVNRTRQPVYAAQVSQAA